MSSMADFLFISSMCVALGAGTFCCGYMAGSTKGETTGYCQALADIEAGKKPLYELKKQEDGTMKWETRDE